MTPHIKFNKTIWSVSSIFLSKHFRFILSLLLSFEKKSWKNCSIPIFSLTICVVILGYLRIQSNESFPKAEIETMRIPYLILRGDLDDKPIFKKCAFSTHSTYFSHLKTSSVCLRLSSTMSGTIVKIFKK